MQCGSNSIKHEQHSVVRSSNVHDELEPENININLTTFIKELFQEYLSVSKNLHLNCLQRLSAEN